MTIESTGRGGSPEEEYFYRLNRDLIERKRKEQEAQYASHASIEARGPHWMKCPKCSKDMVEIELAGIKVDRCNGCQGIFFDHGELDILIESKEPKGFLGAMKGLFR